MTFTKEDKALITNVY